MHNQPRGLTAHAPIIRGNHSDNKQQHDVDMAVSLVSLFIHYSYNNIVYMCVCVYIYIYIYIYIHK